MEQSLLESLREKVRSRPLPRHVAIIMDGNGRWAEARGLSRVAGHREGSESVRAVTREARKLGIEALTLYAFSAQNWARPPDEVAALMQLLAEFLDSERAEIMENAIRLAAIGELDLLVRTSGERRISNFLLWQCAYAELAFCDVLWPDFRELELLQTIGEFQSRERRFGLTGAQVAAGARPA